MNTDPPKILPRVTGIWFNHHHSLIEMGEPNNIPVGMRNMLTMECSYPCAKKIVMGSHMAAIFPMVERETNAIIVPTVTIQLARMALTTAVPQPLAPMAS